MSEIDQLSVVELADKIKSGQLTCVQVASKFIENIEKNRDLNALIYFNKEEVLKEAESLDGQKENRGRLHGVPVVIKDNIHVKGIPNTAGCPGLKEFIPKEDAPIVRALRNEGALIVAKANMHELAFGSTSQNEYYGDVPCVYNRAHCAGGSSGGSAVAVASRQAAAALGSDTGGSVRIPATINAICGLRPTTGRYSQSGITSLSHTRDTGGPMANCCEDLELLDSVITGETFNESVPSLNQLKIGIPKGYLCADVDPEVKQHFEKVVKLLVDHGCQINEVCMDKIEKLDNEIGFTFIFYETGKDLSKYLKEYAIPMTLNELVSKVASRGVRQLLDEYIVDNAPKAVRKEDYDKHLNSTRPQLIDAYNELFHSTGVDLLMYPALACLSPELGRVYGLETISRLVRNNSPTSNAGIPSLTVPVGKSVQNLPIGIHLDALFNRDQFLLKCGALIHKLIKENS